MDRISGLGWWTDSQSAGDTGFYSGFVSFCPLVVVALETELRTRLGKCSCLSCNSCSTPRTDISDLGVESFPTLISLMPAPPVPGYFLPEAGLRKTSWNSNELHAFICRRGSKL